MVFLEVFNETGGITATDDSSGIFLLADVFGGDSGSGGISGVFGVAEKAVPDDSVGVIDIFS